MGDGFDVDTTALAGLVRDLDDIGRNLYRHRDDLSLQPDAGRTSGEAAQALAGLAATIAGLAEHLGTMSVTLEDTVAAYQDTDSGVDQRFRSLR